MRSIYRYTWKIISILLGLGLPFFAESKEKRESTPEKTLYGVFIEADILHPLLHVFNSNRMGLNADIQLDIWHKLYPTIVLGYDWFDASDEYNYPIPAHNNLYKVNGLYMKFGALYNIWKKDFNKAINPMAFLGLYYSISPNYHFSIENYPINNNYFGRNDYVFSTSGKTTAQWGELAGGVKTPIAKNFCMGFEVSYKLLLHIKDQKENNHTIHQSYAPGFGDREAGVWGFRYTISYFFHL